MSQTVLEFLNGLRPGLPMSMEKPCQLMSGSELRRVIQQGGVLINSERVTEKELVDFQCFLLCSSRRESAEQLWCN